MNIKDKVRFLREEMIDTKTMMGHMTETCFAEDKTSQLWRGFKPQVSRIPQRRNQSTVSLQVYPSGFFRNVDPRRLFQKWALAEVEENAPCPEGLQTLTLSSGRYAVFHYRGPVSEAPGLFSYLLTDWMKDSPFDLDERPHFEILGPDYNALAEESEELIYIPIKLK